MSSEQSIQSSFLRLFPNYKSPKYRVLSVWLNGILVGVAACVTVIILLGYIHPTGVRLLHSVDQLISTHAKMGLLIAVNAILIGLGAIGIILLRRQVNLLIGLQIIALLFVTLFMVAMLYTYLMHWFTNVKVGVTFSVQQFNPEDRDKMTIAGIQRGLRCCGRESYKDYYIANMAIPVNYVPYSCCDLNQYNDEKCYNSSRSVHHGRLGNRLDSEIRDVDTLVIPKELAYTSGCEGRIQYVLLPVFVSMSGVTMAATILCIVFGSIYLHFSEEEDVDCDKPLDLKMFSFIPGMQRD
ncbi:hypothetical protein PHET_01074 [Paragonimus heterotremus]|uniref:Tetraspanin n=1 Tax=Paragonimus heterotremus TaxID=100268 RepID=A0A8J4TS47_9TREM|nr:hypothetical protein PHET_01074 [Paragonimus heterotremus]